MHIRSHSFCIDIFLSIAHCTTHKSSTEESGHLDPFQIIAMTISTWRLQQEAAAEGVESDQHPQGQIVFRNEM